MEETEDDATHWRLRVAGSEPLRSHLRLLAPDIEALMSESLPTVSAAVAAGQILLPEPLVDGRRVELDDMSIVELRRFLPELLKLSTGRNWLRWADPAARPQWWPDSLLPWRNVKQDWRSPEQRAMLSYADALREVVRRCYRFHGQSHLLLNPSGCSPVPAESQLLPAEPERQRSLGTQTEILSTKIPPPLPPPPPPPQQQQSLGALRFQSTSSATKPVSAGTPMVPRYATACVVKTEPPRPHPMQQQQLLQQPPQCADLDKDRRRVTDVSQLQEDEPAVGSQHANIRLPVLTRRGRPAKLEDYDVNSIRRLLLSLVGLWNAGQADRAGRRRIRWGCNESRPAWWPLDILPFLSIKEDRRSIDERRQLRYAGALRQAVRACYRYYRQEHLIS